MSFGMADVFIEKNNEPTDNEIIKALECCMDGTGRINCENCPLTNEYCRKELPRLSLLLIRTLQAENERLQKHNTEYARKHYQDGRAEAIKEFAERLKKRLKGNGGLYSVTTMNAQIDNLVKEMVGEDE